MISSSTYGFFDIRLYKLSNIRYLVALWLMISKSIAFYSESKISNLWNVLTCFMMQHMANGHEWINWGWKNIYSAIIGKCLNISTRSGLLNMLFKLSNIIVNLPISYSPVNLHCIYVIEAMLLDAYEFRVLIFFW